MGRTKVTQKSVKSTKHILSKCFVLHEADATEHINRTGPLIILKAHTAAAESAEF